MNFYLKLCVFTLDFCHYDKFDVILRVIFELRIYQVQIHVRGPYRLTTSKTRRKLQKRF